MALSNNIIATLNFIAILCSIPIITAGIWLASKPDNECIRWLRWPVLIIGILFLLLALTGFIGAYWNKQGLLAFFLFCNAALIIAGLALLILAFVVTRPSGAYSVPGRSYKEYRLTGYSKWLRDHITDSDNWGNIRVCLSSSSICTKLAQDSYTAAQFFASNISPLQIIKIAPHSIKVSWHHSKTSKPITCWLSGVSRLVTLDLSTVPSSNLIAREPRSAPT